MNIGAEQQKKIGLIFLVFIGFAALYAGFASLPGKLIAPFHLLPPGASGVDLNKDAKEQARLLALKAQDTDEDGLFDYDELYLYKTSPYLSDSDSDGFSDQQEISNGYDPNCPKDQDCRIFAGSIEQGASAGPGVNITQGLLGGQGTGVGEQVSGISGQGEADLSAFTPDQLRTLLKQNGFSEAELAKLDDATLVSAWQTAMAQSQGEGVRDQVSGGTKATASVAELRQELLNAGMDPKVLEKISDAELLEMYRKVIKN